MAAAATYRGALRNRDFRLLAGALTQSAMGDWAYSVALVVYIYDHTHSAAWLSAATLARMIPRFFSSPYAGVVAERFERVRVMVTADLVRAVLMAVLTVVVATSSHVWLAIAVSALLSVTSSVYDPSTSAMIPQLLGEEDLAAGNALLEVINNIAIIGGPAIGAIVLALGNPSIVMGLDTVTFLISAALVVRLHARSKPTDVSRDGNVIGQMLVGVRAIVGDSTAALLTAFTIATTFLYGVDTVLFVFLSRDKLGTGTEGYGYLLVALGVGGVIAAAFVNKLAALPRLSVVLSVGMVAYAAPTALLLVVHSPGLAFGIEVVRGIATLVVDVLAMTALQRSLAPDLIARVFGVFWALVIAGLGFGAFVAPLILNGFGLNTSLLLDAFVVPVLVVLVYPKLFALDRVTASASEFVAPRVSVMQRFDIFAAASRPALERLASSATEVVYEPGTTLIRQGENADALYVLAEGRVEVLSRLPRGRRDRHIRYMSAPAYVGEIGLLQGVPRTATVVATEATKVWRIDGEEFLSALTDNPLSAAFTSGLSRRLARTRHDQTITLPDQHTDSAASVDVDLDVAESVPQ